jgi:hypothetical protein
MKFLVSIILIMLFAFVAGLYLGWWSIAIVSFLVTLLIHQRAGKAFLSGFLAIFLLWAGLASLINIKNDGVLASKIATVLPLAGNPILLLLVTGLIGGLVAGFAAMSASYLRASKKL